MERHFKTCSSEGSALYKQNLNGLVVKTLAYCTGGYMFNPRTENLKFSMDPHQQDPS